MFESTLRSLITVGGSAFVLQKALKCFGKQDYADLISFTGICFVGVNILQLGQHLCNVIVNSGWYQFFFG